MQANHPGPGEDADLHSGGLGRGPAVENPSITGSPVKYDNSDDVGSRGLAGSMRMEDWPQELKTR